MTEHELVRAAWQQTWQVTVVAITVWGVVRLAARNRPHLAHALWLVVLLKCVTPPIWSSPSGVFSWLQGRANIVAQVDGDADSLSRVAVGDKDPNADGLPAPSVVVRAAWNPDDGADVPAADTELSSQHTTTSGRATHHWVRLAGISWSLGVLALVAVCAARWYVFHRRLFRDGHEEATELQRFTSDLARRLRLRRRVRVKVTRSDTGPAVLGLWRPTVLLPAALVQGRAPAELEPILVHELIHLRRGDLRWGLLQLAAQTLWWFHPLVWLVNRLTTREAERCCDEETIAELGCAPARYARCLLDVLEQKRVLRPVPAVPGVRPVDITSSRLERIMSLGQGSHRRAPWWCRGAMLVAAALVLPGAALFTQAEVQPADAPPASPPATPAALPANVDEAPAAQPVDTDIVDGERTADTADYYQVDDLLERAERELHVDRDTARAMTLGRLTSILREREYSPWAGGNREPQAKVAWSDNNLRVQHNTHSRRVVEKALQDLRRRGFRQVMITARLISGQPESIDQLHSDWIIVEAENPDAPTLGLTGRRSPEKQTLTAALPTNTRASMTVEKQLPVRMSRLTSAEAAALRDKAQGNRRINLWMSPQLTVPNSEMALLQAAVTERPFVVGIGKGADGSIAPVTRVVNEGLQMQFLPTLGDSDGIKLDLQLTICELAGVETTTLPRGRYTKPITLQVPEVRTMSVEASETVTPGETLLIGGLERTGEDGKREAVLVMLEAAEILPHPGDRTKAHDEHAGAALMDELLTRSYDVGDLLRATATPVRVDDAFGGKGEEVQLGGITALHSKNIWIVRPRPVGGDQILPIDYRSIIRGGNVAGNYQLLPGDRVVVSEDTMHAINDSLDKVIDPVQLDFDALIDLIKLSVAPDTWSNDKSGPSITPYENKLTLVVRHTEAAHRQLATFLEKLRALRFGRSDQERDRRAGQVELSVETIDLPYWAYRELFAVDGDEGEESEVILPRVLDAKLLKGMEEVTKSVERTSVSKTTLPSGADLQAAVQLTPESIGVINLTPTVTETRDGARITFSLSALGGDEPKPESLDVPNDGALIFDLGAVGQQYVAEVPVLSKIPQVGVLFRNVEADPQAQRTLAVVRVKVVGDVEVDQSPVRR